jgi:YVTN family beta-propeller protein
MIKPTNRLWFAASAALLFLLPSRTAAQSVPAPRSEAQAAAATKNLRVVEAYGRLPLSFEANQGQTDRRVKFLSRSAGQTLFLTSTEAVLTSTHSAVRMKLLSAYGRAQVSGLEPLAGNSNFFLGNDPAKWRAHVPTFARVRYADIYPGVDLVYYGNHRELEYDFLIAPGADPRNIRLKFRGAKRGYLDHGDAVWQTPDGEIRLRKPRLYQQVDGKAIEVVGGYVLQGPTIQFAIGEYDHLQPLVIDPVLVYSTYLGGSGIDLAKGISVDSSGDAIIAGYTASTNFPVSSTPFQSTNGGGSSNVFVAKLNAAGTALFYATYLGGNGGDQGSGIAMDSSGNAFVTGTTNSVNFPTTPGAFQTTYAGSGDAFVTKLNATGDALVYSTYLGGSQSEGANSIAVDASGNAYVTGETQSINFPATSGAFQTANAGGVDAFVTKVNAAGTALVYSTYLGGSGSDAGFGLAVDSSGNTFISGQTSSTNFPGVNTGSVQAANGGGSTDAFVAELNSTGSTLVYATYLGGNGTDLALGIALDSSGNAYVTGYTSSTNFPVTSGAMQTTNAGGYDGFVAKINLGGTALGYSTYLGGSGTDVAVGLAVDSSGNAYVAGATSSSNFPGMSSSSVQSANGGGASDAFVAELNPAGSALVYATYLGGSGADAAAGIALDASNNIYIAGYTGSTNFPLSSSPVQSSYGGGTYDAFVAKLGGTTGTSGTAPTTTTISSSATSSVFGQQVSFSIVVSPSSASSLTPSGSVTISDGSTTLGAASLSSGTAVFNTALLSAGNHRITAAYEGDSNFSASTSGALVQAVNQGTTVDSVSASPNPSIQGQPVVLTATVNPVAPAAGTPSGTVAFLDGATSIGTATLSGGQTTLTISSLSAGSHSITCAYQGDVNFVGSNSAALSLSINPPPIVYFTNTISVGTGPVAAVINPITHTLFVVNQGSNDVSAIDTRTNSILDSSISVGKAPSAIGVNRITNQVYVANRDSADITIIDGTTYNTSSLSVASINKLTSPPSQLPFHPIAIAVNESSNQVFVGSTDCDFAVVQGAMVTHPGNFLCGPLAMAVSPISGNTFVAEYADSIIEQYQRSTDAQIKNPGFNDFIAPQALAMNDPFVFAADADQGTGRVDVMNEMDGTSFQVTLGGDPYAVAVNPVDGEVYVASQSQSAGQAATVSAVSVLGRFGTVDVVLPVGQTSVPAPLPAPNKIAVDSTNNVVYVTNEASNNVTVIDGSGRAVTTTVPVGTNPRALLVNPDNCKAYVANFGSGTVSVLDPQINGPGICLSSNWLTFPAQLVNTKSAPQTVTLTNIGNATLLISSIMTSPAAFIESDDCAPVPPATTRSITPGAQCQMQAVFGPTVPGFVKGQILISDNNSGSPQTIVLTGNAVIQPTVNLTVDTNPAVFGQSITLTANVSGGLGTPTGAVTFYNGPTVLGIVGLSNGTASINNTLFAVGSPTITASYSGDFVYAPASSPVLTETVNKASTKFAVFLSSSITSNSGDSVTFESSIQVVPPGSGNATEPSGPVTFFDGQSLLGSATIQNGTANFSTSLLTVGSHSISANYPGDANLLGSTSPVLTQVVVQSSGGGGTGGGTGGSGGNNGGASQGCGCSRTGPYQPPATPSDPTLNTLSSPGGTYSVIPDIDGSGKLTGIDILRPPSSNGILHVDAVNGTLSWGFSPDDDRLVITTLEGQQGSQISDITVYDLTTTPPRKVVFAQSPVGAISSTSFSPSGRYFLANFVTSSPSGQQGYINIFVVQDVASQLLLYHTNWLFSQAADKNTGVVSQGFSPVKPETSFVFAYIDSNGQAQWQLVSLAVPQTVLKNETFTNNPADFWEYSPCGDVIGVVTQTTPIDQQPINFEIDLISTVTGAALPGTPYTGTLPSVPNNLLDGSIFLSSVSSGQQLQLSGGQPATISSSPGCANTPAGNNITVLPPDTGGSGQAPVTVTFGNVSVPGATTEIVSAQQTQTVPVNFKLGTPPLYFDLTTTATFSNAKVCVSYANTSFGSSNLVLLHYTGGATNGGWQPPTPPQIQTIDPVLQIICVSPYNSFSPFAVVEAIDLTTAISISSPPVAYGTPASAAITAVNDSFTVTGNVSLSVDGGTPQVAALSNGSASFNLGTLSGGSHSLSANFGAQGDFSASTASGSLTVSTVPLTVTAPGVTRQYGQQNPALNNVSYNGFVNGDAASSSLGGILICTSVATPASPAGSYPITCSGLTSSNYSIAYNAGTLAITSAPLTITANNRSKTYGQTVAFAGTEFSASGLINSDRIASVNLTSPGAVASATVAGSPYPIIPGAAVGTGLGNYTITYVNGSFTVAPALLTIAAGNLSKALKAPNPALAWTPSGFVNGETVGVLTSNPTCATTATTNSTVGSYPITCSGANAANYTFSYTSGTLKILYSSALGHVILQPINADGTSVFNQGRTIPAKFSVYDANGVSIGTPGVVSSFFLTGILSGTTPTSVENVVDTNNPDTSFRWDPTAQQWIFNITTGNLTAGSTYIYTIALNDGSTIVFQYGLR